jgi:DNA invertase Pin-like site-specific DNA recombinase
MLLGYCRVSIQDQSCELQQDALLRADDIFVVWKLDRFSSSVKQLMDLVGKIAEMKVHQRSRRSDRKIRMTHSKVKSAHKRHRLGVRAHDFAANPGVSIPTLYCWLPAVSD